MEVTGYELAPGGRIASWARMDVDSTPFDLLGLPDLAKEHICGLLDVSSLMNLRLTCKGLKAVVEQPSVLVNLPIKIFSSKQLQRLLLSNVQFNNFVLSFQSLEEQSHFSEFVRMFGKEIRILRVKCAGGYQKVVTLLKTCKQLVELEIDILSMPALIGNSKHFNKILHNFRGLRKLLIHELREQEIVGLVGIQTFLAILRSCQQLIEFKIPSIQTYNDKLNFERQRTRNHGRVEVPDVNQGNNEMEENWEEQDEPVIDPIPEWNSNVGRDILIHSVVDYIRFHRRGQSQQRIKRIDIGSLKHFLWRSFKDLLQICYENGIKLANFHSSQLLGIKYEISAMNRELCTVFDSAKVAQIHDGCPLSFMDSLAELNLFMDPTHEHEGLSEEDTLVLPSLKFLRVQFMFGENRERNALLLRKLFNEFERPTVKILHLQWLLLETCRTIFVEDISRNFRNLTDLVLDSWDGVDDEFNMLWVNLLNLQKISIKDCKNLNNFAFVGRYDLSDSSNINLRPLNRLRKLKTLIIRDTTGNVNDVAIMESFRWISLKHFEFDSTRTLNLRWDLYNQLSESPLGKSVEYFIAPLPLPHLYLKEKYVMRKFRNLKHRRLF